MEEDETDAVAVTAEVTYEAAAAVDGGGAVTRSAKTAARGGEQQMPGEEPAQE